MVRGADRAAVRGAHEGRGEVVVAAAKVISVAATMASAETKVVEGSEKIMVLSLRLSHEVGQDIV